MATAIGGVAKYLNGETFSILVGLGSAVGDFYFKTSGNPVFTGLVLGMLTEIVLIQVKIRKQSSWHNKVLEEVRKRNLGKIGTLAEASSILITDKFLSDAGQKILDQYINSLQPPRPDFLGCEIAILDWALKANTTFWKALYELQRLDTQHSIIVKVTHMAAIETWKAQESQTSLMAQRDFISAGGKIERIFIGQGEFPDFQYIEVMNRMCAAGIQAQYCSLSDITSASISIPSFDFAIVEDQNIIMKWCFDAAGRAVNALKVEKVQSLDREKEFWNSVKVFTKDVDSWKKDRVVGLYFGYHYSTGGDGSIIEGAFSIGPKIMSKKKHTEYKVKVSEKTPYVNFEYEGIMHVESSLTYFHLGALSHEEKWHIVTYTAAMSRPVMQGIYSGASVDGEPYGGRIIISRERLSEDQAKKLLGNDTSIRFSKADVHLFKRENCMPQAISRFDDPPPTVPPV